MRFIERDVELPCVPKWADFLLSFGYNWPQAARATRRIALVSMPCDSAAAGLVALGIMRKRLEQPDGSDKTRHLDRLFSCAQGEKCDVRIKHRVRKGLFRVNTKRSDGVWFIDCKEQSFRVLSANAFDWAFEDEPFVEVKDGAQIPYHPLYACIGNAAGKILEENLRQSDSFLCLAGRASGEASTEATMSEVGFEVDGCRASLAELLTVYAWSNALISRTAFFNPRLSTMDREVRGPQVVVADGHKSWLRSMNGKDTSESDIIGVYHRAVDRTDLEDIGTRAASLQQWYEIDRWDQNVDGVPPAGINVLRLVRK
jgi:hypothetical protein